jgi:hypothetical protein
VGIEYDDVVGVYEDCRIAVNHYLRLRKSGKYPVRNFFDGEQVVPCSGGLSARPCCTDESLFENRSAQEDSAKRA